MNYLTVIIGLIVCNLSLNAQNSDDQISSGIIDYEQIMQLDIKIEGDASQFAHLMPKDRKMNNILFFNENASLYKSIPENEENEMDNSENEGVVIRIDEPEYMLYTDFKTKTQIEQKEFMTRQFLIENKLDTKGWKLTGNNKEILGYSCQEAVKNDDKKRIKAWFTSDIPVSTGPAHYIGLPGAVLAVDIDNGQLTIEAKKITAKDINENELIKPKKGKKITQEEFKEIVDEKMKEMGAESDGSGRHVIMKIQIDE